MRVLHVITSLSVGGAETMLRNVALRMQGASVEQAVLSLTTTDRIGAELAASGLPVTALNARAGVLSPANLSVARRLVRTWRPDLIHSWMYHANVLAYWLRATGGVARPALITSVRGALDAPRAQKRMLRIVRRVDAMLSARADAIIFNSRSAARQHVQMGYAAARVCVIPNGFDTDSFKPDAEQRAAVRSELRADGQVIVGVVGRFNPLKGHRVFVGAAADVARRLPNCRFVLVGRDCNDGNAELVGWLTQLGLRDRTHLLGERRDVSALMNGMDIVVCPSLSESFPNAVGEAMACGKPCVVTDVGDCGYLVGAAGLTVPAGDEVALARAITSVASDEPERERLGQLARARIAAEFALERIVGEYVTLYRRTLSRSAP